MAQEFYITEWQKETATEANGQTAAEPTEMDLGITATGIILKWLMFIINTLVSHPFKFLAQTKI